MITKDSLVNDLKAIGIQKGDMLLVKASYHSVGKIEGGPKVLVDAVLEAVGKEGTVVVVAFAPREMSIKRFFSKVTYTKDSPTYTGAFNSVFIKHPDSLRSENPLQSYAAIGKYAHELIDNYKVDSPPYELLKIMAEKYHAKNLQVGGNVIGVGTTHISLTENMKKHGDYQRWTSGGIYYWDSNGKRRWLKSTESIFCSEGHKKFYPFYLSKGGIVSQGKIGNADSLVSDMYKTLQIERDLFNENPHILLCDNPGCLKCRKSFSFSQGSWSSIISCILEKKGIRQIIASLFMLFVYLFLSRRNRQ